MRALVHLNSLELGGTQINAVQFAAALRAHDIESSLVARRQPLPDGPSLFEIADEHGMRIETYEQPASIVKHARLISMLAEHHRSDLVHVYGTWGGGSRPTYWGPARIGRRPWIQTVYEMQVSPVVQGHMPLVVGTSYLEEELRTRPGRTVLIRPPVDLRADHPDALSGQEFRRRHGLESATVLTIVSRLDRDMKSLPICIAIDAMATLAQEGTCLVIVGSGDNVTALQRRAQHVNEHVGRDMVRFAGPMADPRPAYAAADVMLGMGGSAARSLAFGKPLVVQGEAGWSGLFEPSTAAALARSSYWSPESVADPVEHLIGALSPVLRSASLRDSLGRFGLEFAAETFGLDAMADKLAGLYRDARNEYSMLRWVSDLPYEARVLGRKVARKADAFTTRLPARADGRHSGSRWTVNSDRETNSGG